MGVAVDQLFAHPVHHIIEGELSGLPGHGRVEHHLEQHVAQLLLQVVHVHAVDGVGSLIGLLQHILPDGPVGLRHIPGAAPGGPEQVHDPEQVIHLIAFYHLKIYHNFASLSRFF